MRLIDADALRARMYHDAFETDSEMQRWDSGCWIRYKMFENAIEDTPVVDAIPVEWLNDKFLDVQNKDKALSRSAWLFLRAWQEEQEAR